MTTLLLPAFLFLFQAAPPLPINPAPPASSTAAAAAARAAETKPLNAAQAPPSAPPVELLPVITKHELKLANKTLHYTTTTGQLPIKNANGETEASLFFVAYTLDGVPDRTRRPMMFSFNGGPGSASVWLHMGVLGPKRVKMLDEGGLPPAPYQLVDNEYTWLDQTDMVFIDPVGTGYSRAAKPELAAKFFGVQGDIESVGEFIRLYLSRYERWSSPLFLIGESYGTTRAAGLSGYLIERGIAFNGVLLISTVLNFETNRFNVGNDLPYMLFLPTYAAAAWYHHKLPPDLQQKPLRPFLHEVEQFASTRYAAALMRGDQLEPDERKAVIAQLARYTGLEPRYVSQSDLRIEIQRFTRELLREQNVVVGRLDSRLTGPGTLLPSEQPEFDPSMTAIRPPYTALFNQYVRTELGYKSDLTYYVLGGGIGPWNWGNQNGYADTGDALRSAFAKNPHMKLFVGMGYYDLATPYYATSYTLHHLGLQGSIQNVTVKEYPAGHMFYIQKSSLAQLRSDAAEFLRAALPAN